MRGITKQEADERIRYLEQYKSAEFEIDELLDRATRLRARAERITPPYGSDGGSSPMPNIDKIPALVELIIEEEERTSHRVKELMELQKEIQAVISKVPDETCRALLIMRYIGGKSFEQIAVTMNYSHWYLTHTIHQKALEKVKIPPKTT